MTNRGTIDEQIQDAKHGAAVLIACLVQELETIHPGLTDAYEKRLSRAYYKTRERDTKALDALELIDWTRELLTGFSTISGQGRPFLADD